MSTRTAIRSSRGLQARRIGTSTRVLRSQPDLTGADKLLDDARRLEDEERRALAKKTQGPDPNDPAWTGEERVQDTVLRMVMDKYKPLRIRGDESKDPADEKIRQGIQQPSAPGPASIERQAVQPQDPASSILGVEAEGGYEGGRKLPKTPDAKPWRAVYVRPAHLGNATHEPSVYYGQFLKSSSSPIDTGMSSEMRTKLRAAGMAASMRTDDPKAMTQLRQGLKSAERRGKLVRARESVLDYQLSKPSPSSSEGVGDEVSDVTRDLQLQLGHAQGWDSVVEKRIKAAQEAGVFRHNKLRGRPIERDMDEKNPFLAREEYFMNRIVKRQGAAPPWVELNTELDAQLQSWRARCADSWVRRASRMITTSHLASGLESLHPEAEARTRGEKALVELATRYRDAEWEARERAYHTHELDRLNDLIRRHNHLAPFTARKGLMNLDVELAGMYARAVPRLVREVSQLLQQHHALPEHTLDRALDRAEPVTYDMWGRPVRATDSTPGIFDAWWGSATADRKDSPTNANAAGDTTPHQMPSLGIVAAIQRSLQWARTRLGG